jgi:hypothetical protein
MSDAGAAKNEQRIVQLQTSADEFMDSEFSESRRPKPNIEHSLGR